MTADAPVCRWTYRGIQVDLMATDPAVLGFSNRWYGIAVQTATRFSLRSGIVIQLISAPAFLATKFEDVVNVIGSRARIVEEVLAAPRELREYLGAQCRQLVDNPDLENYLLGLLLDDSDLQHTDTVISRLRAIS